MAYYNHVRMSSLVAKRDLRLHDRRSELGIVHLSAEAHVAATSLVTFFNVVRIVPNVRHSFPYDVARPQEAGSDMSSM
jgi:hypothetical protein